MTTDTKRARDDGKPGIDRLWDSSKVFAQAADAIERLREDA